jgi:hypothetical protein
MPGKGLKHLNRRRLFLRSASEFREQFPRVVRPEYWSCEGATPGINGTIIEDQGMSTFSKKTAE